MTRKPLKVRCTQLTKAGRPCRRWAVRGSDPPTCSSHLRAVPEGDELEQAGSSHLRAAPEGDALEQAGSSHLRAVPEGDELEQAGDDSGGRASDEGFYSPMLSPDELADVVAYAAELTLADEIACTRVAVRRTLEFLSQGRGSLSESDYLRAAGLVFQGARTTAILSMDFVV